MCSQWTAVGAVILRDPRETLLSVANRSMHRWGVIGGRGGRCSGEKHATELHDRLREMDRAIERNGFMPFPYQWLSDKGHLGMLAAWCFEEDGEVVVSDGDVEWANRRANRYPHTVSYDQLPAPWRRMVEDEDWFWEKYGP